MCDSVILASVCLDMFRYEYSLHPSAKLGDIWVIYVLPHVLVYGLTGLDMSIPSCTGLYRVLLIRMILVLANDKIMQREDFTVGCDQHTK